MSELLNKQFIFTRLVADLIYHIYKMGYTATFAEAYRTPEMAAIYAKQGKGIKNSLHIQRLAVDINLFLNGIYLQNSESYKPIGEFWESLSTTEYNCTWGGRFLLKPDGNHFSIQHEGIK